MNLAMLRLDVVVAVRDMVRQEAVTQVCDSCPGPPTRAQPSSTMPEPLREERKGKRGCTPRLAGSKFQRWGMADIGPHYAGTATNWDTSSGYGRPAPEP